MPWEKYNVRVHTNEEAINEVDLVFSGVGGVPVRRCIGPWGYFGEVAFSVVKAVLVAVSCLQWQPQQQLQQLLLSLQFLFLLLLTIKGHTKRPLHFPLHMTCRFVDAAPTASSES